VFDAASDVRLGASRIRSLVVLERRLRLFAFHREQLVFDTSVMPSPSLAGVVTILFVTSGTVELGTDWVGQPPVALVAAECELERPESGAPTIRLSGPSSIGLELRIGIEDVIAPIGISHGPLRLSAETWDRVREVLAVVEGEMAITASDPRVRPAVVGLLDALAGDRVLSFAVPESVQVAEPVALVRLMDALRPMFASYATSPSLMDLKRATGLSIVHLSRELARFVTTFDLVGRGFREATRIMRLRTAVIWLSSPGTSATVVAAAVGYSSLDAMARAFRDAKLPSPGVVRDALRRV
jgi:AraC-like DNA-binding protein